VVFAFRSYRDLDWRWHIAFALQPNGKLSAARYGATVREWRLFKRCLAPARIVKGPYIPEIPRIN
jgi:hypothetical protein